MTKDGTKKAAIFWPDYAGEIGGDAEELAIDASFDVLPVAPTSLKQLLVVSCVRYSRVSFKKYIL